MKDAVIRNILENKLIVIIRGVEDEKLLPLVKAMYDGGVRLVELTYDNSGKVEDEHTAENIAMLKKYFGDIMNIGAGTGPEMRAVGTVMVRMMNAYNMLGFEVNQMVIAAMLKAAAERSKQ